jgi:hypothetical protein
VLTVTVYLLHFERHYKHPGHYLGDPEAVRDF